MDDDLNIGAQIDQADFEEEENFIPDDIAQINKEAVEDDRNVLTLGKYECPICKFQIAGRNLNSNKILQEILSVESYLEEIRNNEVIFDVMAERYNRELVEFNRNRGITNLEKLSKHHFRKHFRECKRQVCGSNWINRNIDSLDKELYIIRTNGLYTRCANGQIRINPKLNDERIKIMNMILRLKQEQKKSNNVKKKTSAKRRLQNAPFTILQ